MERVSKVDVIFPLHLKILLYVLTDHLDFAVRSCAVLVDDQVRVISTKVVNKNRDLETDRSFQVELEVSSVDKEYCDIIVVSIFGPIELFLLNNLQQM